MTGTPSTALRSRHRFSDRTHGDFRPDDGIEVVAARRQALVPLPWTWVAQVHGADVVVVTEPLEHAGVPADAIVTTVPGVAIGVRGGDCGLLLLEAPGMVAVVHAGWRGLLAGVVDRAVATMRDLGATDVRGTLGPLIRPECYEFGPEPMAELVAAYGDRVRGTTAAGTLALDLGQVVAAACEQAGVPVADDGTCTGCSPDHYSFRSADKRGNQVVVAWLEPT